MNLIAALAIVTVLVMSAVMVIVLIWALMNLTAVLVTMIVLEMSAVMVIVLI